MIFTGYYANCNKYKAARKGIKLIQVSRYAPEYIKLDGSALLLAPSAKLLKDFKEGLVSEEEYTKIYTEQLNNFTPKALKDIESKLDECVLLCYECYVSESGHDFCHRHILADFLRSKNIKIKEMEV